MRHCLETVQINRIERLQTHLIQHAVSQLGDCCSGFSSLLAEGLRVSEELSSCHEPGGVTFGRTAALCGVPPLEGGGWLPPLCLASRFAIIYGQHSKNTASGLSAG